MSESPNVFISWSGDRSASAAKAIAKLLPDFVPAAKPWLSISSIDKGVRWREATAVALESANAGIFCLTPENLTAPWLLFEAGAIAKRLDTKTRAWTYLLCGLDHKNIDDPLDMFQGTKPSKQDTHEFLHSIQKTLEPEFDLERFNRRFEKNWHDLDEELKAVAAMQGPAPQEPNLHKTVADIHGLLEALSVPIAETWAEINTTREKRLAEESNHRWLPSSVTFNAPAPPISGGNNLAAWGEPAKLVAPLGILGAPAKPATPSETGKAASMNPADFVDEPKDAPPAQSTAAHVYKRRHVPSRKPTKP